MHRNRPNRKNLRWRRQRSAVPREVSNASTVYRRSAPVATAPPPDQAPVAKLARAGRRAATGTHPDPAPIGPLSGLRHLYRQLLPPAGAAAVHRGRRLPAPAARLGTPGPALVCPRPRPAAVADGLDLASRPLPLLVGDAAGRRSGGAVGVLPGPGQVGRQRDPTDVRGPGAHPTARLAAAGPALHPDWRPRLWQPGPTGLSAAPGLLGDPADQRRHEDPARRAVAGTGELAPAGGRPPAVVPGAVGEAQRPRADRGQRRRGAPAAARAEAGLDQQGEAHREDDRRDDLVLDHRSAAVGGCGGALSVADADRGEFPGSQSTAGHGTGTD